MPWHYQAVKKTHMTILPDGTTHRDEWYDLHECFEPDDENDWGRTCDAVTVRGETVADLAEWLRKAADDVEKYAPDSEPIKVTDMRKDAK